MAEQSDDQHAAREAERGERVGIPPPTPPPGAPREQVIDGEPIPANADVPQDEGPEETEEEREIREMREAAAHGELVLTPEQARRWQHELGLPDAALPANDNESQRE